MAKMFLTELMPWNVYVDGIKDMIKRFLGYGYGFPKNCGYYDGYTLFGDCWCTHPKTMVWSWFTGTPMWQNKTKNGYYYVDTMYQNSTVIKVGKTSNMKDWGGYQILDAYCDDITFGKMISEDIKPCLVGTPDHMGCYFGEITVNGLVYNTHEMTPNGAISPRMLSYVDENGYCYTHKGGSYIRKWNRACKMTGIIDYTGHDVAPTPEVTKPWSIDNVAVYIMRGSLPDGTKIPNGIENRKNFFKDYGYSEDETQQAQDIVTGIYKARDLDILASDLAMRFIGGIRDEDGNLVDGVTRRLQWVTEHYPEYDAEKLFRKAQDKVNDYID